MKYLIVLFSLSFYYSALCQGPPPTAAAADPTNMPVILQVVESCHYDLYFDYYKDSLVEYYANTHGWNSIKIKKIKSELVYDPPTESAFSNAYAFVANDKLEQIKTYNLSLSKKQVKNLEMQVNNIIIHNMINSLNWDCKRYVD